MGPVSLFEETRIANTYLGQQKYSFHLSLRLFSLHAKKTWQYPIKSKVIIHKITIDLPDDGLYLIYTEYNTSKSVSHAVSTRVSYITKRATGAQGNIGRGLICYVKECDIVYAI